MKRIYYGFTYRGRIVSIKIPYDNGERTNFFVPMMFRYKRDAIKAKLKYYNIIKIIVMW